MVIARSVSETDPHAVRAGDLEPGLKLLAEGIALAADARRLRVLAESNDAQERAVDEG